MSNRTALRGIVAGVDGSACSTQAVRWAAREAAMRNETLTLVHGLAMQMNTVSGWGLSTVPLPEDFGHGQQDQAQRLLDEATAIAKDGVGQGTSLRIRHVVLSSPLVPTLIDLTEQAQLVVVGSRGQDALRRGPLGSVSTALVHHAHCPVAVIHEDAESSPTPAAAPVLVGIDGSPASELATAIAFDEASWRAVELVALHAWIDADWPIPGVDRSAATSAAHETLAERLAGWQERYPDVTVRRVVVLAHPAQHLLDEAESAQLVVVGSRGRGGFAGMLLGSVSTAVVHAARIPVIVARQHRPAR